MKGTSPPSKPCTAHKSASARRLRTLSCPSGIPMLLVLLRFSFCDQNITAQFHSTMAQCFPVAPFARAVDCGRTSPVFCAPSVFSYRASYYPLFSSRCSMSSHSQSVLLEYGFTVKPSFPYQSLFASRRVLLMATDVSWHVQPYSSVPRINITSGNHFLLCHIGNTYHFHLLLPLFRTCSM